MLDIIAEFSRTSRQESLISLKSLNFDILEKICACQNFDRFVLSSECSIQIENTLPSAPPFVSSRFQYCLDKAGKYREFCTFSL